MRRLFLAFAMMFGLMAAQAVIIHPAAALPAAKIGKGAEQNDGLVHRVHGYHCRRRYGRVRHWHGRVGHVHGKSHRHCRRRYYRQYYPGHYYRPYYRRRYYRRPGVYIRIGSKAASISKRT